MLDQFLIKINMEMGTSETDRHLRWHPARVSPQVTHGFVLLHEAGFSQDMPTVCHEEGGKGKKKRGSNNRTVRPGCREATRGPGRVFAPFKPGCCNRKK